MKKIVIEDAKRQVLYIRTEAIMPPRGCDYREAFKESYEDRIEKYASAENKKIINEAISNHPGWKMSEFCVPC